MKYITRIMRIVGPTIYLMCEPRNRSIIRNYWPSVSIFVSATMNTFYSDIREIIRLKRIINATECAKTLRCLDYGHKLCNIFGVYV